MEAMFRKYQDLLVLPPIMGVSLQYYCIILHNRFCGPEIRFQLSHPTKALAQFILRKLTVSREWWFSCQDVAWERSCVVCETSYLVTNCDGLQSLRSNIDLAYTECRLNASGQFNLKPTQSNCRKQSQIGVKKLNTIWFNFGFRNAQSVASTWQTSSWKWYTPSTMKTSCSLASRARAERSKPTGGHLGIKMTAAKVQQQPRWVDNVEQKIAEDAILQQDCLVPLRWVWSMFAVYFQQKVTTNISAVYLTKLPEAWAIPAWSGGIALKLEELLVKGRILNSDCWALRFVADWQTSDNSLPSAVWWPYQKI